MINFAEEDIPFLRDVVKAARQRVNHVTWVDRDGVKRLSALSQNEMSRIQRLASQHKLSVPEFLKQAAFIPTARPPQESRGGESQQGSQGQQVQS